MNGTEIIAKFELYVDDSTELSSDEELDLLNDIYQQVQSEKPWEWLKKEWSTTTDGTTTLTLPTDFNYFIENANSTDNSETTEYGQAPKVILINSNPYRIVDWSTRKQYTNHSNICWVDVLNNNLVFAVAPSSGLSLSGDYIHTPATITTSSSPIMPDKFHKIIVFGMVIDDMIIQLFPKASSYQRENQIRYNSYLSRMSYHNSNLQNF